MAPPVPSAGGNCAGQPYCTSAHTLHMVQAVHRGGLCRLGGTAAWHQIVTTSAWLGGQANCATGGGGGSPIGAAVRLSITYTQTNHKYRVKAELPSLAKGGGGGGGACPLRHAQHVHACEVFVVMRYLQGATLLPPCSFGVCQGLICRSVCFQACKRAFKRNCCQMMQYTALLCPISGVLCTGVTSAVIGAAHGERGSVLALALGARLGRCKGLARRLNNIGKPYVERGICKSYKSLPVQGTCPLAKLPNSKITLHLSSQFEMHAWG